MADPSRYRHHCLAVTGLSNGLLLFTSVEGYYLAGPLMGGDPAENPNDRWRLGLEPDRMRDRIPRSPLRNVTAIGRIQICEEVREIVQASAAPDEIVWTSGFCHMANGPYLWLQDVKVGRPARAERLVGEEMRRKVGDLVPAPSGWLHRDFVERQAGLFLAALRSGNRETFARLHAEDDISEKDREQTRLAFGRHRGFSRLRRMATSPAHAVFISEQAEWGDNEPDTVPADDYSATICFCTRPDCSELWPVSKIDADNREDRPYVCTGFTPWFERGRTEMRFTTRRGFHGLPEPRSSALRGN